MTAADSAGSLFARLQRHHAPRPEPWRGEGRQAAVLVAITEEAEPRVVLGRRAEHLPLHPGEIAFPGGKREPEDATPWDTALRETEEEIGWPRIAVQPVAQLGVLLTRSGFAVHPCVVRVAELPPMRVDQEEFDAVFLAPLALFAERARLRLERMQVGDEQRWVPHYELEHGIVWGVTARVLAQLVNTGMDAGLDLDPDNDEEAQ
ncbi:NUDIX hydrolase [Kineobactrum salinum]|uniref:CoA pyrophosphatase n=1 Tax=Kineobactrum salinum TaxID=2708301 RepID=A0A6C0U415_9GAMM|nr:CoA pyrophosphatase [Kineobactrum salinum]QIB66851.1 CoA pyrophosphatase [Kineobactrum salinum]